MGESRHYTMITRLENEKIERKKKEEIIVRLAKWTPYRI